MGKQKISYCKFLVVFLLFILLPGCQSEKAKVSGKIFFKEFPLKQGKYLSIVLMEMPKVLLVKLLKGSMN